MMKIKSDKYKGFMKEREEMYKEMDMDMPKMDCEPVDLYGKVTITEKTKSPGLKRAGEDIKEVYGLEDY